MAGVPEGLQSAEGADGLRFGPLCNTHTNRGDVMLCQAPQGSAACTMSGKRNDVWILGEQSTNVHRAPCPCTTWISDIKGSLFCSCISFFPDSLTIQWNQRCDGFLCRRYIKNGWNVKRRHCCLYPELHVRVWTLTMSESHFGTWLYTHKDCDCSIRA